MYGNVPASCAVVVQRTHAGIKPADRVAAYRRLKIFADRGQKIVGLLVADRRLGWVAVEILVGRADEGIVVLIRDGEADPPVRVLEDVGTVMIKDAIDDDMAALDQAHAGGDIEPGHLRDHFRNGPLTQRGCVAAEQQRF